MEELPQVDMQSDKLNSVIMEIFNGNAILFVGAGFSKGAVGFDDDIPTAERLAEIILKLMNRSTDSKNPKDLAHISDYFINSFCKQNESKLDEFIAMMKRTFKVTEPKKYHLDIVSVPWKFIYTTNYDDVIEQSGRAIKKMVEPLDLECEIPKYDNKTTYCLHINGRIENLKKDSLDNSFKLTHSSYLSSDGFGSQYPEWKSHFTNDLVYNSTVAIFIGYSLYDIEIEKILQQNSSIKDKVIFIQPQKSIEQENDIDDYKYKKYGHLFKIGVEEFVNKLMKYKNSLNEDTQHFISNNITCFKKYNLVFDKNTNINIDDRKIRNFFVRGALEDAILQKETISNINNSLYLVNRKSYIDEALKILENHNFLFVLGDMGNGKTVFLKQLATIIVQKGFKVYFLTNRRNISTYKKEIETISNNVTNTTYVFIDSYTNFSNLISDILPKQYKNIKYVLSSREREHHKYINNCSIINKIPELFIDKLDSSNIEQFCTIINNLAAWDLMGRGKQIQINRIHNRCKGEISNILIDIFESEQMSSRIKESFANFLQKPTIRKHLFVVCLLNVMNIPISIALIEYILDDYDLEIFRGDVFDYLVKIDILDEGNEIKPKSAVFCQFVLKHIFGADYVIKESLQLLKSLSNKRDSNILYGSDGYKVKTNLFKFNFIESILPEKGKREKLREYYENIKIDMPKMVDRSQYWLQYAMCFIAYDAIEDFKEAQRYLDAAYNVSSNKEDNRYVYKIDNQQARLYVKQSVKENDYKKAFDYFKKADTKLSRQKNDRYKFKVLRDYLNCIEQHREFFVKDESMAKEICSICNKHLKLINNDIDIDFDSYSRRGQAKSALEKIIHIFSGDSK